MPGKRGNVWQARHVWQARQRLASAATSGKRGNVWQARQRLASAATSGKRGNGFLKMGCVLPELPARTWWDVEPSGNRHQGDGSHKVRAEVGGRSGLIRRGEGTQVIIERRGSLDAKKAEHLGRQDTDTDMAQRTCDQDPGDQG